MKRIFYLLILVNLLACSIEEEVEHFQIFFENQSDYELEVILYDGVDSLDFSNEIDQFRLNSDQRVKVCDYSNSQFIGYTFCSGQIIFRFPDEKGHFCYGGGNNGRCFDNDPTGRYLFVSTDAFIQDGNEYTFVITQDDYVNAYDIPAP